MTPEEVDARDAELERRARELRIYSRHRVSFALGFGFSLAGVLLGGLSRWLVAAGLVAAGGAWIVSGLIAWQSGMHMFGGLRTGGFLGQYVLTTRGTGGARVAGVLLIVLGVTSLVAAIGAVR